MGAVPVARPDWFGARRERLVALARSLADALVAPSALAARDKVGRLVRARSGRWPM